MDAAAAVAQVQSTQAVFQAVAATLAMTAYLFPPQATVQDQDAFDYIVVGAGSAGSIIANRLTENPNVRVLLVEAGGDPPIESILPAYLIYPKNTKIDWNYTSVVDSSQIYHKNAVIDLTRGKVLGGSSSINTLMYVRGSPEDFNSWAVKVKDESWNYDHVLPYFKKSENLTDTTVLHSVSGKFHGTSGYVGITRPQNKITQKYLDAFSEMGYDNILDVNGNATLGYFQPMYTIANGVRQSTAYSFLGSAKDRTNLYVMKNTLVKRILFDDNKNTIGAIVIKDNGEQITLKANREVILSAGSIGSAQLLMLSGIGPKKHLEHLGIGVIADLPVGQNLQDHTPVILVYTTEEAKPQKPINPHNIPLPMFMGFVAINKSKNYPDYQSINYISNRDSFLANCAFFFSFQNKICQKMYDDTKGKELMFSLIIPLQPKSRGRILLRSTDVHDHPSIFLGVYTDKRDLEDATTNVQDFNRIMKSKYFQQIKAKLVVPLPCKLVPPGSWAYWRCHAQTMMTSIFHYVGTCAMGTVVDSRLRVFGVNRLRVADGSIMPTVTRGNTNAPSMMIGEKASDMIKEDNV